MTRRYLLRIVLVAGILALLLGMLLWLKPARSDEGKWRFFRIGQASLTATGMSGGLVFFHVDSDTSDLDNVALLPGGLAYLPKNVTPLFGHRAPMPGAVADVVLEPGKCLLVRRLQFVRTPAANPTGEGRVLLSVDKDSRLKSASAALRGALPAGCDTGYRPECQIIVWAEARVKKCG